MPLAPGSRLGPYHVHERLGIGGMGEVYRARDAKLQRDVAVKVLPEAFALDRERLARFEREAQVLAALNHPNIAHVYGVLEDPPALVLELVEGEDLAARLARGPLPLDEALAVAGQLANALEAAHERGIVHRDLKPANIRLTRDGTVKVLDFGLAKGVGGPRSGEPSAADSPTVLGPTFRTDVGSELGVLLGTAAYMAPEQAKGKATDKRADIWAFGCVVFEMLAGRRPFEGGSITETLSAILRDEPAWAALPPVPRPVRRLLERCLHKDAKRRLRDIGDARLLLEEPDTPEAHQAPPGVRRDRGARLLVPVLLVACAVLAAALVWSLRTRPAAAPESYEVAIGPPEGGEFRIGANSGSVVLSPDGSRVAFMAIAEGRRRLYVRSLTRDDARPLPGTDGAYNPFWAPDGRRIAFFARGKLHVLDITSGLPEPVADAPLGRGASWGHDDVILFTPRGGGAISRVSARGGLVTAVTTIDAERGENAHYWPDRLPGSDRFLYFVRSSVREHNGIYLGDVNGATAPVRLLTGLSSAIYAPPVGAGFGHLLWVRDTDLLAQPLDVEQAALHGSAAVIASHVRVDESQRQMYASVSRTGMLAWADARLAEETLAVFDRQGRRLQDLDVEPGRLMQPEFAPDGKRLLFTRAQAGSAAVWVHDLELGTTRRVSYADGYNENARWSADGARITYQGDDRGQRALVAISSDGAGQPRVLVRGADSGSGGWSPDDRHYVFSRLEDGGSAKLWVVSADGQEEPRVLATAPGNEINPAFSRDGRWLGYISDRSGQPELYAARVLPDATLRLGPPVQVSSGGAATVSWRADGREVFFVGLDRQVFAVSVNTASETLAPGRPVALFRVPGESFGGAAAPDGQRFVIPQAAGSGDEIVRLLTNWRARLPSR
jgi:eukaryotic-like serine/threonine-protein kinase